MNNVFMPWAMAIYASPNPTLWRELWNHMDSLALSIQGPWLIGWDFNSILYASEKQGALQGVLECVACFESGLMGIKYLI